MFDDEDDDEFYDSYLNDDLASFEKFMKGESIGYIDSDRLEVLIDYFLMNNQYQKASICADYAIGQFSYNHTFTLRKAQAISAMGQLKEALELLSKIEKLEEPTVEFWLTKASIFSQIKDNKNAIKFFKEALAICEPEDRDEIFFDLAMEYENINDYRSAVNVLREALKLNPNNEGAIYEIAYCYDQLGEFQSAIKCYSDYIDENPYSFTAWYNLGNAFSKTEDLEKAIWAYDYCILINQEFGPVYFNLANTYLAKEDYPKAIENFKKCMEIDGEDPLALCFLGEAYEQLNELDLAKKYYQRSLDLAPMLPDAWLGLGIIEDLKNNLQESLTLILKAAELDPENANIYHVLANVYEKLEDFDAASEYFQLSLALDPSDVECLEDYIVFIRDNYSIKEAFVAIQDFTANFEENTIGMILFIDLLWRTSQKDLAMFHFRNEFHRDKNNALELFRINPELLNEPYFINFIDNNK